MKTFMNIFTFCCLAGGWFAFVDQMYIWYCRFFKKEQK